MSVYRHPYMCCVRCSGVKRVGAEHEAEGEGSAHLKVCVLCNVLSKPKILAICKKTIYLNL
jgi:hypothetical protein